MMRKNSKMEVWHKQEEFMEKQTGKNMQLQMETMLNYMLLVRKEIQMVHGLRLNGMTLEA